MRRRPVDASRPPKRPAVKRSADQGPGFTQYIKVFAFWACLVVLDHLFEQRLELLMPLASLWRSVLYIHRVDGAVMIGLFLSVSLAVDWCCVWFLPIHWLFFIGSVHVWVQMLWQADSGLSIATILFFVTFVYFEAAIRLYTLPVLYGYRFLAAHCTGSPLIMLVLDVKELLKFHFRKRRRKEVESENRFYLHLVEGSLPAPLRIQCNDYALTGNGDPKDAPLNKAFSLATAQDMEAHGQAHSGFILWLLRFIIKHVSKRLENSSSAAGSANSSYDSDGGMFAADGQTPAKDNGSSPAREAATAHSTVSSTSYGHETGPTVSRRRHDNKDTNGKSNGSAHSSGHSKASKSAGESVDCASAAHSSSSLSHPGHPVAANGGAGVASGATASGGSDAGQEEHSHQVKPNADAASGKKSTSTGTQVATVAPVASAQVQQPQTSRKETRLQQDLSQLRAKWTASREREDRLSDQVDDLRDGARKMQQELKEAQQEIKEARDDAESARRQHRIASDTNSALQKECDAKADQVDAARQAHDTAENALRDFTRKVAADSSSIHQACHSTQQSLQRECQRQSCTVQHLEQQLTNEKSRRQLALRENDNLKLECVTLERKLSNENREKMDLVSTNRDLRKQLEDKRKECVRLEQQVTEALAVMPLPAAFMPASSGQLSFGRMSSSLLGSMDDNWDVAAKFGSLMASGEAEEESGAATSAAASPPSTPTAAAANPSDAAHGS